MPSTFSSAAMLRPIGPMPTMTAHWPLRSRGERSPSRGSQEWRRWASANSGKAPVDRDQCPQHAVRHRHRRGPDAVVTVTPRARSP